MKSKISELIPYLGLEEVEPWDDETREAFFESLGGTIPPDVRAFYSLTDGGEIPSIECRIYGLEEATDVAQHVREIHTSLPVLPVFESSGEASDPVCVILEKGLAGVVVQFCHDGGSRVHAPSFLKFLTAVTETEEGPLAASDHKFCFPKKLTKAERAVAQAFVDRANEPIDPDSECINADYEPGLMIELAQSMTTPKDMPELFDLLDIASGEGRTEAAMNLYFAGTPAAKAKLDTYCEAMNEFARELQTALARKKIEVTLEDEEGIVPTTWICYRSRRVLVDHVYSKASPPQRWDAMRAWIREMDALLKKHFGE